MNFQRKSFAPNNRNINRFYPLINDVECFICHNYGDIVANCRRKLFQSQVNSHFKRKSSTPKYSSLFQGYCFTCNIFGHKAIDCNRRNMKHKNYDSSAPFSGHVRCYTCN